MADTETPPVEAVPADEKTEEEADSEEWKAEKYRNKVIERIQDEMTRTEAQVPKTATELEEFVFGKAKTRKDYLDLVARLLIYVADFKQRWGEECPWDKKMNKDAENGEKKEEMEKAEGEEPEKKETEADS